MANKEVSSLTLPVSQKETSLPKANSDKVNHKVVFWEKATELGFSSTYHFVLFNDNAPAVTKITFPEIANNGIKGTRQISGQTLTFEGKTCVDNMVQFLRYIKSELQYYKNFYELYGLARNAFHQIFPVKDIAGRFERGLLKAGWKIEAIEHGLEKTTAHVFTDPEGNVQTQLGDRVTACLAYGLFFNLYRKECKLFEEERVDIREKVWWDSQPMTPLEFAESSILPIYPILSFIDGRRHEQVAINSDV